MSQRETDREWKNLIEFSLRQFFSAPWPRIPQTAFPAFQNAELKIGTTEKRNAQRGRGQGAVGRWVALPKGEGLMWIWYSAKQCHGNDVEAPIEMPSCIIRMVWWGRDWRLCLAFLLTEEWAEGRPIGPAPLLHRPWPRLNDDANNWMGDQ